MWTTKYQAELRQLNGTSQVSPPSIFSGDMAWGRTRWFRLMYRCCIISCYNSFIACLIMTLIVIASNYLRLRANSYNPLRIDSLFAYKNLGTNHHGIMVASPTNSTVKLAKLWCQDQTFCHPLFFHWICTDFPGSKLIPPTNDATRMSFFVFHKLLLVGKASPVPWCMWSKNSVGISLDLGIALHLSLGEIRSQRTAGLIPLQSNTRVKSQMIKGHTTHAINCYHWFVIFVPSGCQVTTS